MKIESNNLSRKPIPLIVANINGIVIHENLIAKAVFSEIKIGGSVSPVIDEGQIMKMTMSREKAKVVKTKSTRYPAAYVKCVGKGICVTIEICFCEKDIFENHDAVMNSKRMFAVNAGSERKNSYIKSCEFIEEIKERISKENVGIVINDVSDKSEEFSFRKKKLQLVAISTVFVLNEINFSSPIDFRALKSGDNIQILFSASVERNICGVSNIYELCGIFPTVLPKTFLIDNICVENKIDFSVYTSDDKIYFKYEFSDIKDLTFFVPEYQTDDVDMYISILSFRY